MNMFFNKEEIYAGYSMHDFSKVVDILKREGMKYSYKVVNPSRQKNRVTFGSFGLNSNFENLYVVKVRKKDAEIAKYFIQKVLHSHF